MADNLKAFLIKDIREHAESISFQYKGFIITLNQDEETNGNLHIDVAEYIPKSKDYSQEPLMSFTVDRHLGRLDWEDTWFDVEENKNG